MSDVLEKTPKSQVTFPVPGDVFVGRFKIESVLSQGGFGCIYKARQLDLKRAVAIKVLRPASRIGFQDDAGATERRLHVVAKRFEREAQIVSQLRDPNTVMMYEYGQTPEGLLFMVLEYIDGRPLSDVIEVEGKLSVERSVSIVKQVLRSLVEAHAHGMLHRDIKPQNIMLYDHFGRVDQVKVLDFGLAKSMDDPIFNADDPDLTDDDVLIGTPRYMSPEQIRGHRLAPSTDLYSLGLVFFELLTGEKAVQSKSTMHTLARHINDEPIRLPDAIGIDGRIEAIVHKMIEKNVEARYQTATEVLNDLEHWPEQLATDVELEEIPEPAPRRKRLIVAVSALLALMLVSAILYKIATKDDDSVVTAPPTPMVTAVVEAAPAEAAPAEEAEVGLTQTAAQDTSPPMVQPSGPEVGELAGRTSEAAADHVDAEPTPRTDAAKTVVAPKKPAKRAPHRKKPNLTTLP